MRSVRVVAAVIRRGGRVLVTRRFPGGPRGGQWEFPGGKVEPGEPEPDALRREISEELACEVAVGELLCRARHRYPDLEVELAFYDCALAAGAEPRCLGADALEWSGPDALPTYDFCEADLPALPVIAARLRAT
ncbi:(deoxy)nucleoside triphosphate pyrophosphohydrolase [Anaeromyxobacter paludicola]|uniref:8-oxo-dGTP diphosphatase n=1 Tax=Anaeromyxobacter paludicola TaxID=2918171 RepID=A0ABN6N3Q2_9BACT|nr:(deoxy)nucleoside triphosphate pyrophosphohydrolase [Anaeromyxobacter paludicola]BDG07591.1 NUDIX hydrolase [Anaeromyxobacter paludicola]